MLKELKKKWRQLQLNLPKRDKAKERVVLLKLERVERKETLLRKAKLQKESRKEE